MHVCWSLCKNDVSNSVVTCHAIKMQCNANAFPLDMTLLTLNVILGLAGQITTHFFFLMFVLMLVLLYVSLIWCSRTSHVKSGHPSPNHCDYSEVCFAAKWGWFTYIRHFYLYSTAYILVHQSTLESFFYLFIYRHTPNMYWSIIDHLQGNICLWYWR
jgi:hypothetical protein